MNATEGRWVRRGSILVWTGPRPIDPPPGPTQTADCGTDSGYHRHIKRTKTPACDECKAAHRVAQAATAERRRRRKLAEAEAERLNGGGWATPPKHWNVHVDDELTIARRRRELLEAAATGGRRHESEAS